MDQKTESVRINKDLKKKLKDLSQSMRPRTAIQYLIEDAVEQYLEETRKTKLSGRLPQRHSG